MSNARQENQSRYYDAVVAVEQHLDVDALTYRGVHIWPIVRDELYHKINTLSPAEIANSRTRALALAYDRRLEAEPRIPVDAEALRSVYGRVTAGREPATGADLVLLSRDWEHRPGPDGRQFNRYIDPYLAVLAGDFDVVKIELAGEIGEKQRNRWWETAFFPMPDLGPYFELFRQNPAPVEGMDHLNDIMRRLDLAQFNEKFLRNEMDLILAQAEYFKIVLNRLLPKLAGTTCYYCNPGYGLMKACHDLGIPSVDIQHGGVADIHCSYMHYSKVPEGGYDLLPDFFWVWSDYFRRKTEQTLPPGNLHHRTIIGGDMDLTMSLESSPASPMVEKDEWRPFIAERREWRRNILVAPGVLFGDENSINIVIDAILQGPDDWFWMIRAHPYSHAESDRVEWEKSFKDNGLSNFDIKISSEMPLGRLLPLCDHLVTSWSGICFDALALGIPSTFTDPHAAWCTPDGVRDGYFFLGDTPEELLASIREHKRGEIDPGDAAPVLERGRAKAALDIMLGR